MIEIWKVIPDCNNRYTISNLGRVMSFILFKEGKLLKPMLNTNTGYYRVVLMKNSETRYQVSIHKLVAQNFVDNPDSKPEINHKDRCRTNNVFTNLEWCTRSENIIHGYLNPNRGKAGRKKKTELS